MGHSPRRRARIGSALVAGLLVPTALTPTLAAQAAPAASGTASDASGTGLGHATLTWQGGRSEQQLGQVLAADACDFDADGRQDLSAGAALGYGSERFADMAAARRTAGYQDAYVDLPQWWSAHLDAAAGGWTCAGDVNADGHDDVVQIPATTARTLGLNLFGAERNAAGRLLDNRVRNYQFPAGSTQLAQRAAGPAGDLDGDGRDDVVLSQHTSSSGERSGNGRLWVLAGVEAPTVPSTVQTVAVTASADAADVVAVIDGAAAGDALGTALAVGDVDQDGFDDLALASPSAGKVWLIRGRAAGAQARHLDLADLDPADGRLWLSGPTGLGSSLALADDVNGDGRPDLVVGAAAGVGDTGGVAVVFGSASPAPVSVDAVAATVSTGQGAAGYWIAAAAPGDALGHAVAALGDLDGDGRSDLLIGAPGHDVTTGGVTHADDGAAYVLSGRAQTTAQRLDALTADQGYRIDGTRGAAQAADRGSRFGYRVSALGDVDGNGAEDFAIGAPGHSENATARSGGIAVALRGELESSLGLAVSRRVGDGGALVTPASGVLRATDQVDLRANLRLSTGQGVSGAVRFTVDGVAPAGCEAVSTTVSAPHRAFAFCEQGITISDYGRHEIGAEFAGQAGSWRASSATPTAVLVTDQSRVAVDVAGADRVATATVVPASSAAPVEAGTVGFAVAGTPVAGCAGVPVAAGRASCALPAGVDAQQLEATFSGITAPSLADPSDEVTVLAASTGGVAAPATVTMSVSRAAIGYGDEVTASVRVTPVDGQGTVDVLVDGRIVAQRSQQSAAAAPIALPRTLAVGSRRITATLRDAEGAVVSTSAAVTLRVNKATVGRVRASAPRFARGSRPRLTVTVGRLSNGAHPLGTVRATVRGRTVTAKLTAARRGKVTLRLPVQRADARVTVRFVPEQSAQVARPAPISVKVRTRR